VPSRGVTVFKRILVCGGRTYKGDVTPTLERFNFALCITGGALGADSAAYTWAVKQGIPVKVYSADWKRYGKAAGFIRNTQMLIEGKPDLVIAFPGGIGTAMMCKIAREAGVEVVCV
jgi:hypothetical protein